MCLGFNASAACVALHRHQHREERESLLTGSDGNLWNGNNASCHYSSNPLPRSDRYRGENSETAMITDKLANNISQLSLCGTLNSNCYERHAWRTENHSECSQTPQKLKALEEQWGKDSLCWEMVAAKKKKKKGRIYYRVLCVAGWHWRRHRVIRPTLFSVSSPGTLRRI